VAERRGTDLAQYDIEMSAEKKFLPYGRQQVDEDDIAAVAEVLRGDWLTTGPAVEAFEQRFAQAVGAPFAASCANGTAALHLAALALGLGEGDCAVVPAMTFLATANAVRFTGAEVIFADVDPETGLMRPDDLMQTLKSTDESCVKAVFSVCLNGQCAEMKELHDIAAERDLHLVHDACHALGTDYLSSDGGAASVGDGRHGTLYCFSFHPVKTIAMGEGGAVTTGNEALHRKIVRLRSHGMTRDPARFEQPELAFDRSGTANPWYYEMPDVGYNYRASDIHCALGLSQLEKLEGFVAKRRKLAGRYEELLVPLAPMVRPVPRVYGCDPAWHLFAVLIDFAALGITRAELMGRLRAEGVGTQVHYIPVPWQPYYRKRTPEGDYPGAAAYYEKVLSLPLFTAMSLEDVERVVATLSSALGASA
jgi:UDP-4-amino-4,6-dideoxy-N-acetyl-beta-L-altrosamine transaminase